MTDYIPKDDVTFGFLDHAPEAIPERPLTAWEQSAIAKLLAADFPERLQLRAQAERLIVTGRCPDCPTVEFRVAAQVPPAVADDNTPMTGVVPFAIQGKLDDGMGYMVLLHVSGGYLRELQTYRGDSGPLPVTPDIQACTLLRIPGRDDEVGSLTDAATDSAASTD